MMTKRLALSLLVLASASRIFGALVPYAESLERADAIAIVTVTACEQTFDGSFIRSSAILSVDTPIAGVKKGTRFKQEFGLPQKPGVWKDGAYSQKTTLASDTPSYQIAERYLVLLQKNKDGWSVIRESWIIDDIIGDGYFESFSGSRDVSVSKAINILKVSRKEIAPNHSPKPTRSARSSLSFRHKR